MNATPIATLIEKRLAELGISRAELARRCGYVNIAKGIRRIAEVCRGELGSITAKKIIATLPSALMIDAADCGLAVRATESMIAEGRREAEEKRRASFVPHGYLLGSRTVPSQITLFAITGGSQRHLLIPLNTALSPITFVAQALEVVRKTPSIRFFGDTSGFMINFTPDNAVRFDINGDPVEHMDHAYEPGDASVYLRNRDVTGRIWVG